MLESIILVVVSLVALKAATVGSDFSFYLWWKYRDQYLDWYIHRPSNEDFVKEVFEECEDD